MTHHLVFNIPSHTYDKSPFPGGKDYDYWAPLLNYFLLKSDRIEIHCWNEEKETINEVNSILQTDSIETDFILY